MEKNAMPTGEGSVPTQPPVAPPAPAPMPAATPIEAASVVPPMPQQPPVAPPVVPLEPLMPTSRPEERIMSAETPIEPVMRPIDLSMHEGVVPQGSASTDEGKKKIIILAVVIVAGLVAGTIGFFVWRSMTAPVEEASVIDQNMQSVTIPVTQPVAVPVLEADDMTVIEQELNALNDAVLDKEAQDALNAVNAAL